jgi:multiple antibiotic resistance protein
MIDFWLCFVPLFVAVDAIGALPMFMALTEGLERSKVQHIILQSIVTGIAVALIFVFFGPAGLRLIGITVGDFMVAGGILLLVISISDLLSVEKKQRHVDPESMGAVPIGVPLIVGPAVLTTLVLLVDAHGKLPTVAAVVLNIGIAGVLFWRSQSINRFLGASGAKTLSKLASLLLAAIAVMIIRKGLMVFIQPQ